MKLLVIAHHFPPDGSVATFRVAKFVKYLGRLGWDIGVITVNEKHYRNRNARLCEDVEGAKVIRTGRLSKPRGEVHAAGLYWLPYLVPAAIRQVRSFEPDILYLTGDPFLHWILAPVLKLLWGLPYVLDFRDPWTLSPYWQSDSATARAYEFLGRVIEPMAVSHADGIINVTEPATELYRRFYAKIAPARFHTVCNGFDPEDMSIIDEAVQFTPFDIVYLGKFGRFRDPRPFLEGFRLFIEAGRLSPDECRFVWVGNPEEHVLDIIHQLRLTAYCELVGFKPYGEALRYVKGSSWCLLVSGDHPYEPTTKVFDYIALTKPILALLGCEGFLTDLLAQYSLARTLISAYGQQVASLLGELYDTGNAGTAGQTKQMRRLLCRIDRAQGAALLSDILRRVVGVKAT